MDVSEIVVCYVFPSFRNSFVQCKAPVIYFFTIINYITFLNSCSFVSLNI